MVRAGLGLLGCAFVGSALILAFLRWVGGDIGLWQFLGILALGNVMLVLIREAFGEVKP
jgi:hypothetical protein